MQLAFCCTCSLRAAESQLHPMTSALLRDVELSTPHAPVLPVCLCKLYGRHVGVGFREDMYGLKQDNHRKGSSNLCFLI